MTGVPQDSALPPGTTGVIAVDLDRLAANWRALAGLVAQTECAAVVKADAYGLGAERCIPALVRAGCRTFFVATHAEAETARRLAAGVEIYVLDGLLPGAAAAMAAIGAIPVLSSQAEIRALSEHARATHSTPAAALHICSGLNRLGLAAGDVEALSLAPERLAGLDVRLVMSHLASADTAGDPKNTAQLSAFRQLRRMLPAARASLSASDGLMLGREFHFDLVRPGYALYGGQPSRSHRAPVDPVVSVHARILQIRDVSAGEAVGYSGIWQARRPSRIATIAAGYADGIPRTASATSEITGGMVAMAGIIAPIVGRVSMDLVTVDVTEIDPDLAQPGGWVELIGPAITLEAAGTAAGTIGYEILTRLGRRFHRIYSGGI
ncbi:MAG: alanine racemase [Hyphomicrobium sp.]